MSDSHCFVFCCDKDTNIFWQNLAAPVFADEMIFNESNWANENGSIKQSALRHAIL